MASGVGREGRTTRGACASRHHALTRLHEFLGCLRPFSEEEFFHLELEPLAMRRLDGRQPVFVDEHDLVLHPLLPRFLRHVLEDALAELARIRRAIEAGRLLLQQHAIHHSRHDSFLSNKVPSRVLMGAGRPTRCGCFRSYQSPLPSRTRVSPRQLATTGVMTRSKCVKLCSMSGNGARASVALASVFCA